MDYYSYGDIRLDEKAGTFNEQRKYAGQEYDVDTGLSYMNARYYNGKIGRFVSVDPAYLLVGDQSFENRYQRSLEIHLSDPQALNSYSYALNNPMVIIDPTGELSLSDIGIAMSNSQRSVAKSFHNFAKSMEKYGPPAAGVAFVSDTLGSVSDRTANVYDPRLKMEDRIKSGGMVVLDVASGGRGSGVSKAANGLKLGESIPSLGRVINNASGKITGFNHNGTYHGLDQIISRGVNPELLAETVKNPIARFAGRFDRVGYLSKDAYVVLDKSGQVVTAWTKNEFKTTISQVLSKIK